MAHFTIDSGARASALDRPVFEAAMEEMRRAIGAEHVATSGEALERAARATIPHPQRPSALLRPGSADEANSGWKTRRPSASETRMPRTSGRFAWMLAM